jgi:Fe-S oxidoreductase
MGLFSIFKKSNTLYFPGCITYFKHKEIYETYKKIFSRLGIDFQELFEKICCGLIAFELGYESEARRFIKSNQEIMEKNSIKSIITNCPACYNCFKNNYKEILPDWNVEVLNLWEIILNKLQDRPGLIKNLVNEEILFLDNCYLGRYSGIYEAPRKILELLGYKIKELPNTRENSLCCGGCGGLSLGDKTLSLNIAKQRIKEIKQMKIKKIIVCSLRDYDLLKEVNEENFEIYEISEILAEALSIKINLENKKESEEILGDKDE